MVAALIALAFLLTAGGAFLYNGLVTMRQFVRNSWADVDVYLKRRAELIPNLVTAVKAYASHESTVLEAIATARSQALTAGGAIPQRAQAESSLTSGVTKLFMLAENYPELKANQNFLQLQQELSETEKMIANARQYYNACVRDLNTKVESFPSSIIASMAGVKQESFFELEDPVEREAPKVG